MWIQVEFRLDIKYRLCGLSFSHDIPLKSSFFINKKDGWSNHLLLGLCFCPLLKKSLTALSGRPVQNTSLFFALIKKIFLQNLVEIIFEYHKKYF